MIYTSLEAKGTKKKYKLFRWFRVLERFSLCIPYVLSKHATNYWCECYEVGALLKDNTKLELSLIYILFTAIFCQLLSASLS